MVRSAPVSFVLLALLFAACGEEAMDVAAWPSEAERILEEGHAPTPFTAEQIRAGCPSGRLATFRVIQPGREPFFQTMRFLNADEEGVEVEMAMKLAEGVPMSTPKAERSTWQELQAHGSFEAERTIVSETEVTTEAGTFPAFLYEVTVNRSGEPPATNRIWFAKELPGPPVKVQKVVAEDIVLESELVSNVVRSQDRN